MISFSQVGEGGAQGPTPPGQQTFQGLDADPHQRGGLDIPQILVVTQHHRLPLPVRQGGQGGGHPRPGVGGQQAPKWRPGAARFDTWLHRVALNLCYDRLRRRREIAYAEPPERADEGPGPDRGLQAADTGRRVGQALQALPDRQREAIVLCHYQELGNIEAAAAMGVSVEALESLLGRGRRALRAAFIEEEPDDS